MSVLIKGIDMPTGCIDCPFMVSRNNDDCILQSAEANENFGNWEQMKADCPLVFVPEHGRLIDADEILQHDHQHYEYLSDEFYITVRDIENAPTIIPADKED